MLLSLFLTPLIGIFLLKFKTIKNKKFIALTFSSITFLISIFIWSKYLNTTNFNQFSINCYFLNLYIDGISIYFILLTTFLTPIAILSNWKTIEEIKIKRFYILILTLEICLLAVFLVSDLFLFYIFFEATLPLLFLFIGIFGSTRKELASFYIFLFTFAGSLFMLIAFITIFIITGSSDFSILHNIYINPDLQKILWLGIFLAIMIKTPLWPFHIWLPLAHSEAPLAGSIILAGIILKLALYAILRILLPILPEASNYFTPFVFTICTITIIYSSLATLRQIDLKVIVAYSSISHMGVCTIGAFSNDISGIAGSILLGIAHGLTSPALFFLVGGILYDRYHTRTLNYYKGLTQFMPIFSLIFFFFTLANMGTPFSANFIGEFLSLSAGFQILPIVSILAATSIILSAAYSIYFYNRITGGIKSHYLFVTKDINRREFFILLPLIILTLLIGIMPNFIIEDISLSLSNIIK